MTPRDPSTGPCLHSLAIRSARLGPTAPHIAAPPDSCDKRHVEGDVLIVDDDPSSVQLLGRILSGVGKLRFATSGRAALPF